MSKQKKVNKKTIKKEHKILILSIGIILFILIALAIVVESVASNLTIKNNTDLKLEYLRYYFVGEEGPVMDPVEYKNINSQKILKEDAPVINLMGREANLEIRFKFENYDSMFVDAGYFNDEFKGSIDILFEQKDSNNIDFIVKASNGLLPSKRIQCNDKYNINLKEGYIED